MGRGWYNLTMESKHSVVKRFKMIASSYAFLVRDGKILLSRRKNTGYADGMYSLPAGHVEDGETLKDCLIREAREEVGVTIKSTDASLVHVMHRKETDIRMDFFFTVRTWVGQPTICELDKCDDLLWCRPDALPLNTAPYIRVAVECWQKGIGYSERGWQQG